MLKRFWRWWHKAGKVEGEILDDWKAEIGQKRYESCLIVFWCFWAAVFLILLGLIMGWITPTEKP